MREKTVHDLRAMQQNQDVYVIDVRTPGEFGSGHVPGAVNYPLGSIDCQAVQAQASGRPIVTVCKTGGRSRKACQQLLDASCENVATLSGGTDAWKHAGYPIEGEGPEVISIERQVRIGAGVLVLLGVFLGFFVAPALYLVAAFVGAGLIFAGVTDFCGMGIVLGKMPWNQQSQSCCTVKGEERA